MLAGPSTPIRVALIGYGLGGEVFHAPLVDAEPDLHLATIITRDPDRRARAAERYPEARIVDAAEALWAEPAAHDLVIVCTPNVAHVPLATAALEAGSAVVVDKPLAASADDGRALARIARERGRFLSVFQNRRWDGDFLTVRRLIDDGALGPVLRFESRFERWRPEREDGWRERGAAEEAGGLLWDLGSHLVDQAIQLFGRPTHVYAEVDLRRPGVEADDDVFVALTHPGWVRSHLWASATAVIGGPRFRVLGLRGAYEKHGLDPQEDALASGASPTDPGFGTEPEERWGRLVDATGERRIPTEAGDYAAYYRRIVRALRTGEEEPVEVSDAIEGLEVLEAARESARTGRVVVLPA